MHHSTQRRSVFAPIEVLENRVLLSAAPQITAVGADNRGQAIITLNAPLDPATVSTATVKIFDVGPDLTLGTADDAEQAATVGYDPNANNIVITTVLETNTSYRLVVTEGVHGADGTALDGEFNGVGAVSGDGTPGGNFDVTTQPSNAVARFVTRLGIIDVGLLEQQTPQTISNFVSYANSGVWDTTFFHRSVPGFIIQGGGFTITASDQVDAIPANPAVVNEPGVSNTRGTIAMAKLGSDPNSATNQWFFNVADNSSNLDNQNGGFTVFGSITNQAGLDVMDGINGLETGSAGAPLDQLPVIDGDVVRARGSLDPNADFVTITRVAMLMDLNATGVATVLTTIGKKSHFTDPDGTATTISLKGGGSGTVLNDNGQIDINLSGITSKTTLTISGKGGNGGVDIQDIVVNGALKGLIGKNLNLSGTLSSTGAITTLTLGNVASGGVIAGPAFGTVSVGTMNGAQLLSGTLLGADNKVGGGDDQHGAGFIKSFKANTVNNSVIAAGLDPVDGVYFNGDDTLLGGSAIVGITVKGDVSADSLLLSTSFGKKVKIGKTKISDVNADPRFRTTLA